MIPVLANTTVLNVTSMNTAFVPTIDPTTVLLLAVFSLVFTILGLISRGAVFAFIAAVLSLIVAVIYAGGFVYYDPQTNTLVLYQSTPIGFLYSTFFIINVVIGIYKVFTYPVKRR